MARSDDYRRLIEKLNRLAPIRQLPSSMRQLPSQVLESMRWLEAFGNDPNASEEAKQHHFGILKFEAETREHDDWVNWGIGRPPNQDPTSSVVEPQQDDPSTVPALRTQSHASLPSEPPSLSAETITSGILEATEAADGASFVGALSAAGTLAATEAEDEASFSGAVELTQVDPPPSSPVPTEPPVTVVPRPPSGSGTLRLVHDVVCKLYPPGGALPKDANPSRLRNAVVTWLQANDSNEKLPSLSSVGNYIDYYNEQLIIAGKK